MTRTMGWASAPILSGRVAADSSLVRAAMNSRRGRAATRLFAAVVVVALGAGRVAGQTCVGDCKGDGSVDIGDLITGVNIVLGSVPASTCTAFQDEHGTVDIAQIIQGVNNALNGCPVILPTPTPGRFTDNGNGTITDSETGLMWEKKDRSGGLHDDNASFVWAGTCSGDGASCQPDAAAAATCSAATGGANGCAPCVGDATCATLQGLSTVWQWLNQLNAASFAGHNDWRLPTVGQDGGSAELESIVDTDVSGCGMTAPCVPPAFDTRCTAGCTVTTCSCTLADFYWSATSLLAAPDTAWEVYFYDGSTLNFSNKTFAEYVRAVRGGS